MQRIDPYQSGHRYLRPLAIYPDGRSGGISNPVSARSDLKLAALLYDNLTLPASTSIQVPALRSILLQLGPLLENSLIVLSMRSSVPSFSDLVDAKSDLPDVEIRKHAANFFDHICPSTLRFDPSAASENFATALKKRMQGDLELARFAHISEKIGEFLSSDEISKPFEQVINTFSGHSYRARFHAHCKIAYSIAGATNANSDVILPKSLISHSVRDISLDKGSRRDKNLEDAHSALLDYFSLDSRILHKIDAFDILELRNSSLFARLIVELREGITEAEELGRTGFLDDRKMQIQRAISQKAEKELRRKERLALASAAGEDVATIGGGLLVGALGFVPMNLVKEGVSRLIKISKKNQSLSRLIGIDSTPMQSYVSELQDLSRASVNR
jgi:hypothetical protein